MADTTPCKALVAFSDFVEGHGIVHGDPDSTDKAAKAPKCPITSSTAWLIVVTLWLQKAGLRHLMTPPPMKPRLPDHGPVQRPHR